VNKYINLIQNNHLPVFRGYHLSANEKAIRDTINEVMCNHYVNLDKVASGHHMSTNQLKNILHFDPEKFKPFLEDDLLEIKGNEFFVKEKGFFLIRNIAMAFDPMLRQEKNKYSKTI
jgi:oxygen-independent coproporphyrinogen-3 oxidase